ncbi:mitochondrial mRNA pseudouridine synthase RPUSD3 isoform X2 [Pteronotus mesoamericanus]|uniref:mitochondrial mRNA pseudouridine synthase RPUSD3 isoform X2 n=1 Tax=Pteronotus mesoamericanus TaxID=1884717 RepID=UPI0023ED5DA5|nr:mitochondrial mRNA pseudouridine synthase RPUSD3 isoform X2 [Pteronotus parnellii mesoamericanus]
MGGYSVLGHVSGGWWRAQGVRAALKVAGFGAEAWHQLHPRGFSKRSRSLENQPFPGLLQPENLSREELVDVLRASVVDQKGKPGELTLFSVLPELSQSLGLGEQELQVVHASGKETSGLVLLSSCPQTACRLRKFFAHSRRAQRPTATYWAVTDGIPATSEGKIQAALKLEHADGIGLVVPVKSPSRKDILEGVKRTLSHFRVVATGSGCALVQLQPLTVFPSQLQVHMVLQLCPVLGDHRHSARMRTVLGQRFLLPAESTKPQRQVLDEALLRRLCLTPSQAAQLPLHLHLRCLQLPGTRPRDGLIELLAPLPPYFSRTLQCLGLHQQ